MSTDYSGTIAVEPDYFAVVKLITANGTTVATAESDQVDSSVFNYRLAGFSGSINFSTGHYYLSTAGTGTNVQLDYTVTSTDVVRDEPITALKALGAVKGLARPEDEEIDLLVDETYDEYPWLRAQVVGGELIERAAYAPVTADVAVDVVDDLTPVLTHSGVDVDVIGIPGQATDRLRIITQDRPTDAGYRSGQPAVGYTGSFKNLAELTEDDVALVNAATDAETLFEDGFAFYHVGLAQGVLVADLPKFFGPIIVTAWLAGCRSTSIQTTALRSGTPAASEPTAPFTA